MQNNIHREFGINKYIGVSGRFVFSKGSGLQGDFSVITWKVNLGKKG